MEDALVGVSENGNVEIMKDDINMGVDGEEFSLIGIDIILRRKDLTDGEEKILKSVREKIR